MQLPFYKITKLIESYEKVEYNQVFFSKQDLLILINFNFKHIKSYYFLLDTLQLYSLSAVQVIEIIASTYKKLYLKHFYQKKMSQYNYKTILAHS
ncbi:hypothetical protein BGT96_05015 [Clostridioides difficile]|nr:hypothetical protein [Clostridioides difficile]EGT4707154.1 hypothetical protein [Clostridioides difficile]EGT4834467.1 hypothetical protein [Clostridioides difficile]EGT4911871.1 hypothetical protein [Clostridioides difficile]EGT5502488.1 hypothetical protein [Clostridioides difficile]